MWRKLELEKLCGRKKMCFKKKTTPTCVPTKDSQIPSISVSHEQLMRNELSELRKEVREEFKDIRKLINDNFNIIMSILKVIQYAKFVCLIFFYSFCFFEFYVVIQYLQDQKNNDNAGQGSQPFTSPILSENQNQDNTNNHNAAQGRQHFTKSVDSENQNQSEGDESSNNGSEEVFQDHSIFENSNQGDISDIADNQVDCENSPVRNLINVDAGFSSSKSIIPSPSFVRPLVFESQHDFTHQHDNDEEDQFIFPTPIQSIVPLEGSPQSQFELDDSLMPSLSDIKSNRATDYTINSERSIIMHNQNTSNESSNIQKKASKDSQNQKSPVHTPLHAHRIRRPGPFNTSPYIIVQLICRYFIGATSYF
ncbi:lisH domain-containing protein C1711.05-like isoform X2 [Solanum lycopersicum]|uniref:lisH domain-containing protein C1711.05-like isoform X2 n=1 Tax=Solanum lycopersicum TaxID=4081 RepID=UPI00374817E2